ncbi:hypothetical protein JKF63_02035 [Porcisia hertigi]|uniref:Uncharacterized protein n=1 Tax=Porcisia hertigi TaxID=2761500 RepID=A0A836II16_9TRYP|nr:hypothetical protein JKF63_02035 [Porcisia hertigi]
MLFPTPIKEQLVLVAGVLPIGFYVALAVVCSTHQRWVSVVLSVACALAFFALFALKYSAVISALVFARFRTHDNKSSIDTEVKTQLGSLHSPRSSPACKHLQADLCAASEGLSPIVAQRPEEDVVLSSILGSTALNVTANDGNSISSSLQVASVHAAANPFQASWHAANAVRVTHHDRARTRSDHSVTQLEETYVLSPPFSLEHICRKDATALVSSCPFQGLPSPHGLHTDLDISTGNSRGSRETAICAPKDDTHHTVLLAARYAKPLRPSKGVQHVCANTTIEFLSPEKYSHLASVAFMTPASLYVIIILTILTLTSSIVFQYDTNCLFLACPALGVPWLWANLVLMRKAFHRTPGMVQSFHCRLLHLLTDWLFILFVCVLSLGVFVAAFTLEILRGAQNRVDGEVTPTAIRVVSYLAPIVMMVPAGIVFFSFAVKHNVGAGDGEGGAMTTAEVSSGSQVCAACPTTQQAVPVFTPAILSPVHDAKLSPFEPPGVFVRASSSFGAGGAPVTTFHGRSLSRTLAPSTICTPTDDTCSTLSSIVRSSVASGPIIPLICSSSSSSRLSMGKGVQRNSTSIQKEGAGKRSSPQAMTVMTSVPQLKSVTMLYIAYRDIDDDAEPPTPGFFKVSEQDVGMAANRNKQQTISANFEALTESLEDAREQGNADLNAYVLTAYEDAICLIWGLIPFSSEPVLLAVEKARQIMDSFKSRPRPPTSSKNAQQELVAVVVSAPHSLVGLIGTGPYRGIHFFNSNQHMLGAQMLRRGLAMHRRLPSLQGSISEPEEAFQCILLDGRSWNSTAGHILARPCGIYRSSEPEANSKRRCSPAPGVSARPKNRQFQIFYNFLGMMEAKEEEWHLVVQRQEHLGSKFCFLSDAVQMLHQGDTNSARVILHRAVQRTASGTDADNVTLAHMLLEDLDTALGEGQSKMSRKE